MSEQTQELDRGQLKILAYQQKVAELQDLNTDLRVELTIKEQEIAHLKAQLEENDVPKKAAPEPDSE